MVEVKVYTTPTCASCKELLRLLDAEDGVSVKTIDMSDPAQRIEAICDDGMMELNLPVMYIPDVGFVSRRLLVEEGKGLKIEAIQQLLAKIKQHK